MAAFPPWKWYWRVSIGQVKTVGMDSCRAREVPSHVSAVPSAFSSSISVLFPRDFHTDREAARVRSLILWPAFLKWQP